MLAREHSMPSPKPMLNKAAEAVPPHVWFGISAVFHYLGPSFAVLLFPAVGVLGVAWFRIASAALVFAPSPGHGERSGRPTPGRGCC
jgi:inner membrane transporter RhtA